MECWAASIVCLSASKIGLFPQVSLGSGAGTQATAQQVRSPASDQGQAPTSLLPPGAKGYSEWRLKLFRSTAPCSTCLAQPEALNQKLAVRASMLFGRLALPALPVRERCLLAGVQSCKEQGRRQCATGAAAQESSVMLLLYYSREETNHHVSVRRCKATQFTSPNHRCSIISLTKRLVQTRQDWKSCSYITRRREESDPPESRRRAAAPRRARRHLARHLRSVTIPQSVALLLTPCTA